MDYYDSKNCTGECEICECNSEEICGNPYSELQGGIDLNKMLATPVLNKNGKWNIEVECEDETIKIGQKINNLFFKYSEWETKESAINYIKSKEKLELKENE